MRKSEQAKQKGRDWALQNHYKNREKLIEGMRQRHRKERMRILGAIGGAKCVKCGFKDIRALQIDHVHGGGKKEIIGAGGGVGKYYRKILTDLSKYQVLCANCNWIKRDENKELYKK